MSASRPDHPEGSHFQATASGRAEITQVGGDLHKHFYHGVRERRRTEPGTVVDACPYPGLDPFGRNQAHWFFGRDKLIGTLIDRLDRRRQTGGVQMVVAPSGAGKSSLLHAGLLPSLEDGALDHSAHWPQTVFTPTATPLSALAAYLGPVISSLTAATPAAVQEELAADPRRCVPMLAHALEAADGPDAAKRVVIVVDQFEELFTQCADEPQRATFITLLADLAAPRVDAAEQARPPHAFVVAGLRADFYADCAHYPQLRDALEDRQLLVGAMSSDELRETVIYPACDVGLDIEDGLVELLLSDLGASTGESQAPGYEAGRLPLLAYALRRTWQQRNGAVLTVAGYRDVGGIRGAIADTAEEEFADLSDAGQDMARWLFLRLVKIGDGGTDDARRRLTHAEAVEASPDPRTTAAVVDVYTEQRLLTRQHDTVTGTDTVEITHEALLRGWPRLRDWMNDDHSGQLIRQSLEEAATDWTRSRRHDSSLLLRGDRLGSARSWAGTPPRRDLSPAAQAFLTASTRYQRRSQRLRTGAIAVLTVLALVASGAAVFAFQQQREAERQQREAIRQRDLATYHRTLAEADRLHNIDVSLSAQLTLVAHRRRPSERPGGETYTRLLSTQSTPLSQPLTGHTRAVLSVVFSPDGKTLASASQDRTVRLWNLTDPAKPVPLGQPLTGHTGSILSVVFSPDGKMLASASQDQTVRLWNLTDPAKPVPLGQPLTGHEGPVWSVAFRRDRRTLASAGEDGTVRLWDLSDPSKPTALGQPLTGHSGPVDSVAFSPDGRTLASASVDETVRLWDLSDPRKATALGQPLTGHTDSVNSVAFSPRGKTLASVGDDQTVRLWNVSDRSKPAALGQPLIGHTSGIDAVVFNPDGKTLASASLDGTVRLWNLSDPSRATALGQPLTGHTNSVWSVAFSPDGRNLASASLDRTVRLWKLADPTKPTTPGQTLIGHTSSVGAIAYRPDSRIIASASDDRTLRLWNLTDPTRPAALGRLLTGHTGAVSSVAFSPDGKLLASAGLDETVRLWNVSDPSRAAALGRPLTSRNNGVWSVAFSADGKILASANDNQTVGLWDLADPAKPAALRKPLTGHTNPVIAVAFSPVGRILASGSLDQTVRLWNLSDPSKPVPLGKPLTGHTSGINLMAFSPDGKLLASASNDETVRLWNLNDPSKPVPLGKPLTGHTSSVESVAFSADGRTLASASLDQTVRLWNLSDPSRPAALGQPLTGHTAFARSVAFSRDGRTLASASDDQTVRLWEIRLDHVIQRICAAARNTLTPAAWQQYVGEDIPYDPPCA
ncbi:NACHT and WD repeat domain-containing protein [Nonomuraea insulae]|uniref:NACHT and WD repeat domain-containing protein n=1 Tax=Nonomuraea insulae TaxID=1616787 RepID=A0ABW1D034_9ACTN